MPGPVRYPGESDAAFQQRVMALRGAQETQPQWQTDIAQIFTDPAKAWERTRTGLEQPGHGWGPMAPGELPVAAGLRQGMNFPVRAAVAAGEGIGNAIGGIGNLFTPYTPAKAAPTKPYKDAGIYTGAQTMGGGGQQATPNAGDSNRYQFGNIMQNWMAGAEGGFNPRDPRTGQAVNFGIDQRAHPNIDVKNLTPGDAQKIYFKEYWQGSGADKLAGSPAALAVFDAAVQHGPETAKRMWAEAGGDMNKFMALRQNLYQGLKGSTDKGTYQGWKNRMANLGSYFNGQDNPTGGLPGSGSNVFGGGAPGDYGIDEAIGTVIQGINAGNQPMSVTQDWAPPEMSPLEVAPRTDWTAADAAIQDMRPEEILEADKQKTINSQLWKGAAQALMGLGANPGLGQVLAALGGGLLGGKMVGKEEVKKDIERFQDKMAQFKSAVARQEIGKAETLSREMQNETNQRNEYNYKKYSNDMQNYLKTHDVRMTGDGFVSTQLDKDGKLVTTFTPNKGANIMAGALKIAGLQAQGGEYDFRWDMAGQAAAAKAIGDMGGAENDPLTMFEAHVTNALEDNRASEIFDQEDLQTAYDLAREQLPPGTDLGSPAGRGVVNNILKGIAMQIITTKDDKGNPTNTEDFQRRVFGANRSAITAQRSRGQANRREGTAAGKVQDLTGANLMQ